MLNLFHGGKRKPSGVPELREFHWRSEPLHSGRTTAVPGPKLQSLRIGKSLLAEHANAREDKAI